MANLDEPDGTEIAGATEPEGPAPLPMEVGPGLRGEVNDALILLSYAARDGSKKDVRPQIPARVTRCIMDMAAKLGLTAAPPVHVTWNDNAVPDRPDAAITTEDWAGFIVAYHALAQIMTPVTASTLRATGQTAERRPRWGISRARRFNIFLWVISLLFAAFVIFVDWSMRFWGPALDGMIRDEDGSLSAWNIWMQAAEILIPFAYGGLGSCVYLLRSAHSYIAERSFDILHEPEYYGRIILGMIAGGAIVLFVDSVTDDSNEVIRLSTAVLGFLAGYSTEFLIQAIERVINALLPRVDLGSLRRAPPGTSPAGSVMIGTVTLDQLLQMHRDATDANDKAFYESLIRKLTGAS